MRKVYILLFFIVSLFLSHAQCADTIVITPQNLQETHHKLNEKAYYRALKDQSNDKFSIQTSFCDNIAACGLNGTIPEGQWSQYGGQRGWEKAGNQDQLIAYRSELKAGYDYSQVMTVPDNPNPVDDPYIIMKGGNQIKPTVEQQIVRNYGNNPKEENVGESDDVGELVKSVQGLTLENEAKKQILEKIKKGENLTELKDKTIITPSNLQEIYHQINGLSFYLVQKNYPNEKIALHTAFYYATIFGSNLTEAEETWGQGDEQTKGNLLLIDAYLSILQAGYDYSQVMKIPENANPTRDPRIILLNGLKIDLLPEQIVVRNMKMDEKVKIVDEAEPTTLRDELNNRLALRSNISPEQLKVGSGTPAGTTGVQTGKRGCNLL